MSNLLSSELQLFLAILFFRLLMVLVVETSFVPDEYWQGPEVAHKIVFGYGHLTWEWLAGIRSYIYPTFLAIPYWILKTLNWDSRYLIMIVPRVQQSIVTAIGDFYFMKYCREKYDILLTWIVAVMYFTNWFVTYCGARTLGNSMEMSLNLIGLYLLHLGSMYKFTILMVINFVMRPSAVVYWIPVIPKILKDFIRRPYMFMACGITAFTVLHATYLLDSYMYGRSILTWWNFIDFNYLQGKSALFGTHPFHWYLTNCLPLLCGAYFILFALRHFIVSSEFRMETNIIYFFVLLYSFVAHKELRFMLPIVPNILLICAGVLKHYYMIGNQEIINRFILPFLSIASIYDLIVLGYSSQFHLSGITPATTYISNSIAERHIDNPLIWILMPCYSVPVYTHFHNPNATIEFFTCPPLELDLNMTNQQLRDFSDIDLNHFIRMKTSDQGHPDFVMFFSPLLIRMAHIFRSYSPCFEAFHTNFTEGNVGNFVNVLCRTDYD